MMKKILVSLILGALPLTMMAQDDDMYFVPSKKSSVSTTTVRSSARPAPTFYSGSNRSVDEYNRRGGSYYQVVSNDSVGNDIISFNGELGVYPDSAATEDFALTREMSRWDGYEPDPNAYAEGYRDGRRDSWSLYSWHSPWFYATYYPWYDSYWYWRDPWYYGGWYDPWYYGGWYDPWYYGYYRPYYSYWYGGYYSSYYYPYYGSGWISSGRPGLYARNGNTGTIDLRGSSHGRFSTNSTRLSTAQSSSGTRSSRATSSNVAVNRNVSRSGNFSSNSTVNRTTINSSNSSRPTVTTSNSGNFSRSSSIGSVSSGASRSSGGSFGGGGGARSGGSIGRAGRR